MRQPTKEWLLLGVDIAVLNGLSEKFRNQQDVNLSVNGCEEPLLVYCGV
jgi:hypothetical protein